MNPYLTVAYTMGTTALLLLAGWCLVACLRVLREWWAQQMRRLP